MTINDQIKDEKLQYDINGEKQQKYLPDHQENFINMNILLVKIYDHLINNKCRASKIYSFSSRKSF